MLNQTYNYRTINGKQLKLLRGRQLEQKLETEILQTVNDTRRTRQMNALYECQFCTIGLDKNEQSDCHGMGRVDI